jgi:hypothetical protein
VREYVCFVHEMFKDPRLKSLGGKVKSDLRAKSEVKT